MELTELTDKERMMLYLAVQLKERRKSLNYLAGYKGKTSRSYWTLIGQVEELEAMRAFLKGEATK